MTSNKQNFKNKDCSMVFASEDQDSSKIQTENKAHQDKNFKISSIQVMENFFSF